MSTGLVITAPASLDRFCKQMEAMQAQLAGQFSPINKALNQLDRAQKFLVEQYAKSPLAKKRTAKTNLTNAVNAALARARKTWREVGADHAEKKIEALPLLTSSPPALAQHFAANAPNERATHRRNTGSTRALTIER
jgi:hypothetical protein